MRKVSAVLSSSLCYEQPVNDSKGYPTDISHPAQGGFSRHEAILITSKCF